MTLRLRAVAQRTSPRPIRCVVIGEAGRRVFDMDPMTITVAALALLGIVALVIALRQSIPRWP
jgi:hypothetical protein